MNKKYVFSIVKRKTNSKNTKDMEATLNKSRFTDYSDNYKELIGKIVGISQYSSVRFANITEVTKTGFKVDAKGYEKTIFRFDNGFHSFHTEKILLGSWYRNDLSATPSPFHRERVFECIIPKGSEFYTDPVDGEYVSNQIKIVKKILYR